MTLQISQVFSQRYWPGVGDIDDCWVISTLQAVHACAPWLKLPGTKNFREAAGNPDKEGFTGGNLGDVMQAVSTLWPELNVTKARGWGWEKFQTEVRKGRPAQVSINSGKLPERLQFGYKGLHGIALVYRNGQLYFANPLARPHSHWIPIGWQAVRSAIMSYGNGSVFAAIFPTAADAFKTHPYYVPPRPVDPTVDELQAQIATLTAQVADLEAELAAEQVEDEEIAAQLIDAANDLTAVDLGL